MHGVWGCQTIAAKHTHTCTSLSVGMADNVTMSRWTRQVLHCFMLNRRTCSKRSTNTPQLLTTEEPGFIRNRVCPMPQAVW